MDNKGVLMGALEFHGHKCRASVAGVRVGLAALRKLNVKRSGGTQLYSIMEIGDDHGGMCFGDGVQYTTGEVTIHRGEWFPEVMGFTPCAGCGELTAHAYLHVVGNKHVCIPCSGYDR